MSEFPKNIFICWFQGQEHLNSYKKADLFNQNVRNWQLLNPGWQVHFISDVDLRDACAQFSDECVALYDSFDIMHLKIDFGRYVVLYLYGGIYVDMDMYAFRGLDTNNTITSLISKYPEIAVLGLSRLSIGTFDSMAWNHVPYTINNGMMISSPLNPLLGLMIQTIIDDAKTKNVQKTDYDILNVKLVHYTTGPFFINQFLPKYVKMIKNNEPVVFGDTQVYLEIFPYYLFDPYVGKLADIKDGTVAIHMYESSWFPPSIKKTMDRYVSVKVYICIILLIVVIIWLFRRNRKRVCDQICA